MVTVVKSEAQQQAFCPHINKENLLTSFLLISADQLGNNLGKIWSHCNLYLPLLLTRAENVLIKTFFNLSSHLVYINWDGQVFLFLGT